LKAGERSIENGNLSFFIEMKIIIHALGANMGGAIRHLNNFIPALMESNNGNQYILILRDDVHFEYKNNSLFIVRINKLFAENFILRTLFDIIYLPFLALKVKANLVISLLNYGPVFLTKPHINFQRNALFFCPDFIKKVKGLNRIFTELRSALLFITMKCADTIVTPSNSMVELIKKRYPSLSKKNFITLYHGFSIQEKENIRNDWSDVLAKETRIKMLYPTHASSHKGFEILFEALSKLKQNMSNFVLFTTIDESDWPEGFIKLKSQIKRLGIEENVIITGRIPQDQMQVFYKNCDLMVYPSLCESFGFSMVEAIGYGLPIVAADTEVNKEICGDAAIYYSSFDPKDAAEKILFAMDDSVSNKLKEEAKKRMSTFDWSWKRYTSEFLRIVSQCKKN
jgi:glycosyltransferase involved in cell wall biosynthesis